MVATVELPVGLLALGTAYIAFTAVISLGVSLLLTPVLAVNRRRATYFDDWNTALDAPWLFWHLGGLWYRAAELLGNYVLPAPQRVMDLTSGYFRSQVVISLSELGVPDALADGPRTGQQLAADLQVDQAYLERLLRCAARMQLVGVKQQKPPSRWWRLRGGGSKAAAAPSGQQKQADGSEGAAKPTQQQPQQQPLPPLYCLTQLSAVLCERHVNSVKPMVALFGDHYGPFGCLAQGVRSGATPYALWSGGLGHWEHMAKEPELLARFNRAMTAFNTMCPVEAVFREVDFTSFQRLIDVGAGLGSFTAAALDRAPALLGHMFDLPSVIDEAKQSWREQRPSLLPRVSFTSGSFFTPGSLPAATSDRDVFVMRQICHDWPDAEAATILKQVRAAMGTFRGARLLIVEAVIADGLMATTHTPRLLGDVHMLVQYGGAKERTDSEFGRLLAAAGLQLTRVLATKSLFFVLEAEPM